MMTMMMMMMMMMVMVMMMTMMVMIMALLRAFVLGSFLASAAIAVVLMIITRSYKHEPPKCYLL